MKMWKRAVAVAAVLLFAATVASAAETTTGAARRGGGGGARGGERAKMREAAASYVVKAIALDLKLTPEQTEKLRDAYVKEAAAASNRTPGATREERAKAAEESRRGMEKGLEGALGADQAKKVAPLVGAMGIQRSIEALLMAKVDAAKIDQALPVLVRYHRQQADLMAGAQGAEARSEAMKKALALREATAKELAPIIGEEAAASWQKAAMTRGAGARGGQGGGERPRRGGAGGGAGAGTGAPR
jgi:hypothetical protein